MKKSSARRIAASRANGARSRGPVTPEGKQRACRNALKHGFSSAAVVLSGEDWDNYLETRECYIRRFQPADEIELDLIEQMVAARWRQQRIWSVESSALDDELDAQRVDVDKKYEAITADVRTWLAFKKLADESAALALMNRYESHYSRQYHRALKSLRELQANRPPAVSPSQPSESTTDHGPLPTDSCISPNEPNPSPEHTPERRIRLAIHRQSPIVGLTPEVGSPFSHSLSEPGAQTGQYQAAGERAAYAATDISSPSGSPLLDDGALVGPIAFAELLSEK